MNRSIKNEINSLKQKDFYSMALFGLYKLTNVPEYSSLSEMAYILDKNNMLKLCEYFGGQTIKIPTVNELGYLIYAILLYQYVDVEGIKYEDACELLDCRDKDLKRIRIIYKKLEGILDEYSFSQEEEDE